MRVKRVATSVEKVINATRKKRRASIRRDIRYFSASQATTKSLGGNLSLYRFPQTGIRALKPPAHNIWAEFLQYFAPTPLAFPPFVTGQLLDLQLLGARRS
jgi:hypothetical protein